MKNNNKKYLMLLLILLLIGALVVPYTFARYANLFGGNASIEIAKWAVALKQGEEAVSETFDLELSSDASDYVVKDKIAPDSTASNTIQLDLNGTEVAITLKVKVDQQKLTENLEKLKVHTEEFSTKITVTNEQGASEVTDNGNGTYTIKLPNNQAFDSTNGKYNIKVSVTWVNNEDNNSADTNAAKEDSAILTVPVNVTVEQLIATP